MYPRSGIQNSESHSSPLSRRHSLSTIRDEPQPAPSRNRGELRIVIERPDTEGLPALDTPAAPSLSTPIPHYRLGGFRFTSTGTPMLRSSAYTRTSVSDNSRTSLNKSDAPDLSPFLNDLVSGGPLSYVQPLFPSPHALSVNSTTPSPAHSSVFYKLKEPIEPSVFDHLTLIMDDPSVVRYAKGTKQVTAATPARIVAQISSESFMDYELVSDFFLTFRSYLSHSNLLSLLLARLEWAINRPEDDGRVIRIRVFAALRHWILNYFSDDFVPNPDLRTQFCDRLNRMYEELKRRSRNSNSDLKILIDLKKCWNGRCLLYWDAQESGEGSNPDDPVIPGGLKGNQDGEVSPKNADAGPFRTENLAQTKEQADVPTHAFVSAIEPLDAVQHKPTHLVLENPASPLTLDSVQTHSCSLPNILPKQESPRANNAELPHPVLLASPNLSSPMSPGQFTFPPIPPLWRRPKHAHKRSGSFSDSLRDDRAPLPLSSFDAHGQPMLQMMPHPENLIRGNVYGPPEPFLYSMGPPSPSFDAPPACFGRKHSVSESEGPKSPGPAVKTFIKTIQRALNNKPSGNHIGLRGVSPHDSGGKTSPLPRNVSCRPEGYRGRKGAMHLRGNARVDLLCEEAYLSYRKLMKESENSVPSIAEISETNKERSATNGMGSKPDHLNISRRDSIPSQMTRGSKSIVIVDDTRAGAPFMSGGLEVSLPRTTYNPSQHFDHYPSPDTTKSFKHIPPLNITRNPATGRDSFSTIFDPKIPESQPSAPVVHENSSHAVRRAFRGLRKYASHDSVMTKHSVAVGSEFNDQPDSARKPDANTQARAPMLRRRPGGDLRKMQNIREPVFSHKTVSSDDFTETSSLTSSMLQMAGLNRLDEIVNDNAANPVQYPKRYTLDESKHVRRSFEATVAGFAKIPDDDDGGLEATLLKLEGKWQKPVNREKPPIETQESDGARAAGGFSSRANNSNSSVSDVRNSSYAESEDSYCSIPLLERGLADESMKSPQTYSGTHDTFSGSRFRSQGQAGSSATDPSMSIEMVEKTESMQQLHSRTGSSRDPFKRAGDPYEDEPETDDFGSELSSEISIDVIDGAEANGLSNDNGLLSSPIMSFATLGVPTHPLAEPPSPPMTLGHPGPSLPTLYSTSPPQKPLTPDFSPNGVGSTTSFGQAKHGRSHSTSTQTNLERQLQNSPTDSIAYLGHTPFILAYDSEVLARQFAIVEQAALSEVDWKDLVDMRWSHSSQTTLNWVNYLAAQDRKGIDMVVARFNLMVKWAVSEIVLTTDRKLRASTMMKLIHVAVHSRRIRNYATMLQVTIALCSVDCTRLVKTWELVPENEKQMLREMESLIQPTRNFYNLRSEMETCNLQDGCIPFVGK